MLVILMDFAIFLIFFFAFGIGTYRHQQSEEGEKANRAKKMQGSAKEVSKRLETLGSQLRGHVAQRSRAEWVNQADSSDPVIQLNPINQTEQRNQAGRRGPATQTNLTVQTKQAVQASPTEILALDQDFTDELKDFQAYLDAEINETFDSHSQDLLRVEQAPDLQSSTIKSTFKLKEAILYSEILQPPVGQRRGRRR